MIAVAVASHSGHAMYFPVDGSDTAVLQPAGPNGRPLWCRPSVGYGLIIISSGGRPPRTRTDQQFRKGGTTRDTPGQSKGSEPRSFADTTGSYRLSCSDCSYEDTVEGGLEPALDAANAHQDARGDTVPEHFVNLEFEEAT